MSDETEQPEEDKAAEETNGPVGGERLAESRRERQISVTEIAKELHLDESKVRALERNEFESLGAPVFAKGHLRKYAEIVGAEIDQILADYYQLTRATEAPPVVSGRRRPDKEISPGPWIAAAILVLAVLFAWWFFGFRDPAPSAPARPGPTETPAPESGNDASLSAAPAAAESEVVDETAEQDMPVDEADDPADSTGDLAPAAAPARQATLADDEVRLSVTFSADCWTEISDGSGQRLFFDLGRAGRTVTVSGEAPLEVLFGNADSVSLIVNGDDYPIPAAGRRGQTARLTLYGS